MGERTVYCPCENCVHNNVCKYVDKMSNLSRNISGQVADINVKDFLADISINCRQFYRAPSLRMKGVDIAQ